MIMECIEELGEDEEDDEELDDEDDDADFPLEQETVSTSIKSCF